ncbi:MAG: hypothetical protein VYE37_15380 [Pseudomonadota bacterium]|nr:hypothetical protein [Pseudomonadota bacterium]
MRKNSLLTVTTIILAITLIGCSANSASVKTTTSPVDGKTRTTINGSEFSTSYIYPVEGSSMMGMEVAGGSVVDKRTAYIVFTTSSDSGFRDAYFKADGNQFDMTPTSALTDFTSSEYGVNATKEFFISCEALQKVTQSKDVYLRVTFADGFVDYNVSKTKYGADGFEMIKKIAQYCN